MIHHPDTHFASAPISAQIRAFLTELARGGTPLGPLPAGVLRRAEDADPDDLTTSPPEAVDSAWPDLPMGAGRTLPRKQLGRVMLMLLCDESIAGGAAGAGLTPARVKAVMEGAGLDASMIGRALPALSLWLADAGLLGEADETGAPWASPRPLITSDADEVARRLSATRPPTPEAVKAERGRGLRA